GDDHVWAQAPPADGEPAGRAGQVVLPLSDPQPAHTGEAGGDDTGGEGEGLDDRHDGRRRSSAAFNALGAASGVRWPTPERVVSVASFNISAAAVPTPTGAAVSSSPHTSSTGQVIALS